MEVDIRIFKYTLHMDHIVKILVGKMSKNNDIRHDTTIYALLS